MVCICKFGPIIPIKIAFTRHMKAIVEMAAYYQNGEKPQSAFEQKKKYS